MAFLIFIFSLFLLVACRKTANELVITETRPATTKDTDIKLFATSDERFRDAKPSPIQGKAPESWLAQPSNQFRLLNYRFGKTGQGEVWFSISSGTILDNANRWLKQFGHVDLNAESLAQLPTVKMTSARGVLLQAEGEYQGGMGAKKLENAALLGSIAEIKGQILTLKMVGPKDDVLEEKERFLAFAESLEWVPTSSEK